MKTLKLLGVLVYFCTLLSCEKDEIDATTLQGKWYVQNIVSYSYVDNKLVNEQTTRFDGSYYFDFTKEGILEIKNVLGIIEEIGEYTYNSSSQIISVYSDSGDVEKIKVGKLNRNELSFTIEYEYEEYDGTYKFVEEVNLTRK